MVTELKCLKCGAPLDLKSPEIRTIKCEFCDTVNMLDNNQAPAKMGKHVPKRQAGPLQVGASGNYKGRPFTLVGLLEYTDDENYSWWEYLMRFEDGSVAWLQYDDEEWSVLFKKRLKSEVPKNIRAGQRITINGLQVTIEEVGDAVISHVEGQIPFVVDADDDIFFIDGYTPDDQLVSIEYTDEEMELFIGEEVTRGQLGL